MAYGTLDDGLYLEWLSRIEFHLQSVCLYTVLLADTFVGRLGNERRDLR